ncbi:MAG TPA: 5-formyltetrahydrofolate cyclo-ligase [Ohtaekwangia sp.]|nr:5-formyltetrahydrofolate cyclo-ligase [Ohtaekwangia sp.]
MLKSECRKVFHQLRLALSDTDHQEKSLAISDRFFNSVNLRAAKMLHTFLSIPRNKEPDTWIIIRRIQKEFPDIQLVVPRIISQTNTFENFYLENSNDLIPNKWGIPEPVADTEKKVSMPEIDMVLVPLLTFDLYGHRVGYGKGFYDTFLKQCTPATKRIGLSLFDPVDKIEDAGEHDVPLHYCITPDQVYSF